MPNDTKILHGRLQIAKEMLDPQSTDVVLSVGCKRGELERKIRPLVHSIDATDIEDASKQEIPLSADDISFVISDVTKRLPFADDTFDKVLFLEVIEHVPEGLEHKALSEIFRVLKPGGCLVFSTPNKHWASCAFDPAFWVQGHRHYKTGTMHNLLEGVGFRVDRMETFGAWKEAVLIPVYYAALRLRLGNVYTTPFMHKSHQNTPKPVGTPSAPRQ